MRMVKISAEDRKKQYESLKDFLKVPSHGTIRNSDGFLNLVDIPSLADLDVVDTPPIVILNVCQSGEQVEEIGAGPASRMFAITSWLLPTWFLDEFDPLGDLLDIAKERGDRTGQLVVFRELVWIVSRFAWKRFSRRRTRK
jgi:hypothetical protein